MIFISLARELINQSSSKISEKLLQIKKKTMKSNYVKPNKREDYKKKNQTEFRSYLVSCQNEFLSSSGITRVAFMIRAIATISHICSKSQLLAIQE